MYKSTISLSVSLLFIFLSQCYGQDKARKEIINAEYNFAKSAAMTSTKEAFLSHLAASGVVVKKGELVNGIQEWQSRQANSSLLSWYPSFVDVASSGDLGVSTGPWEFRKTRQDSTPSAFGHFVSIWKKQADGKWKVAMDLGVNHAAPTFKEPALPKPSERIQAVESKTFEHSAKTILDLENVLASHYRNDIKSVSAYLSENVKVYRPGVFPTVGKTAESQILNSTDKYSFTPVNGEISTSGEWGYVYGNVVLSGEKDGKQQETKGVYMRVWKKNSQSKWKTILDVVSI